jgi:hypothetical protein
MREKTGTVTFQVFGTVDGIPVALAGATVTISPDSEPKTADVEPKTTDKFGTCTFELPEGAYRASATFDPARSSGAGGGASGGSSRRPKLQIDNVPFHVCEGEARHYSLEIPNLDSVIDITFSEDNQPEHFAKYSPTSTPLQYGQSMHMRVKVTGYDNITVDLDASGAEVRRVHGDKTWRIFRITPHQSDVVLVLAISSKAGISPSANTDTRAFAGLGSFFARGPEISRIEGSISTSLKRSASFETRDVALWSVIRRAHNAISFDRYMDFMNWIFCGEFKPHGDYSDRLNFVNARRFLPFTDTDAYRNIKAATEAFLMANACVHDTAKNELSYITDHVAINKADLTDPDKLFDKYVVGHDKMLPYLAVIRAKLNDERVKDNDIGDIDIGVPSHSADACYGILRKKLEYPCLLELIWSYWNEEGMLIQTMNVITRRFQNMRGSLANDPLANLEIDPLRPLNNLIWGWVQDEQHRLSVVRRNYEYDHHYGLRLAGKAVDNIRTADSRSKFLEAFHTLLSILAAFYKRDDDTTMVADGFPVLNALKEAHLILSQGAHNQFGDLPTTARIEMLMQQWILARPEFREFIPTRIMVAYPEPWMDRVDAMKKLQGWTDTSILHFRNLAIFGEQIILGVRYSNWNSVYEPVHAVNWARYWRSQVQGYLHAYRSVTGVDLSIDVTNARIDATMPSALLVKRLAEQRQRV